MKRLILKSLWALTAMAFITPKAQAAFTGAPPSSVLSASISENTRVTEAFFKFFEDAARLDQQLAAGEITTAQMEAHTFAEIKYSSKIDSIRSAAIRTGAALGDLAVVGATAVGAASVTAIVGFAAAGGGISYFACKILPKLVKTPTCEAAGEYLGGKFYDWRHGDEVTKVLMHSVVSKSPATIAAQIDQLNKKGGSATAPSKATSSADRFARFAKTATHRMHADVSIQKVASEVK